MRIAIVDPFCDKREFQRSPARRVLLHILLSDQSYHVDYYCSEDIAALSLERQQTIEASRRFSCITSYNPLWSQLMAFRKFDALMWACSRRYPHSERWARELASRMTASQTAGRLRRSQKAYDAVIAINDLGLVASEGMPTDCPLIYYNLELYDEEYPHFVWRAWRKKMKKWERARFRVVDLLIIQSEERACYLFEDMRQPFKRDKYVELPVTYPGKARKVRSDYLRKHHPELGHKMILLQQNVGWPRRSEEIAKMATRSSNKDFAIVFNGGMFPDQPACYVQHKRFLDYTQLDMLVASADIGLIFYLADTENERLISHASGQLSHFMMLGIPVIASYTPSLERLITSYKCGIVVHTAGEIYAAAERIRNNYEEYCAAAIACFEAEYDLAKYQGKIFERLRTLRLKKREQIFRP